MLTGIIIGLTIGALVGAYAVYVFNGVGDAIIKGLGINKIFPAKWYSQRIGQ